MHGRTTTAVFVTALALPAWGDDESREPPVWLELGANVRHTPHTNRALTGTLRLTTWTRWNTYLGVEGESGLELERGVSGASGLVGARGDLGAALLRVELVPGRRWERFGQEAEEQRWLVEARARADTWISGRFTIGAALGATLEGGTDDWLAGVYLGVHSREHGTR
jgi:hypothetical protein